jgi:hypothetical protein
MTHSTQDEVCFGRDSLIGWIYRDFFYWKERSPPVLPFLTDDSHAKFAAPLWTWYCHADPRKQEL